MADFDDMWADMKPGSRFGLIFGVVLVIAFVAIFGYLLTREGYAVLFSDMQAQDASSVVSELNRMKVDYQLEEGGTRILVPESMVHEVRLELMGSGIPLAGGVGFEIFDDSDFGMTEFAQKVNFQRALQGELTRTIMSLKEVKYSRVHLVLPESGLFKRKDSTPSASVTVFLDRGNSLESAQISGIQRLIAAAVPELPAAMVTVADQNGVILSRRAPDGSGMEAVSERLQKKMEIERYLTEKVLDVLARTFDPGKVLVSVDATLNFNQVKTTQEHVIPNGVGNLVRKRESRMGMNVSNRQGQGNITTDVEYRVGREVAQIIEMPGEMLRLSISVVLPPGVPARRIDRIRELVSTSIGLDPGRGDAITVYSADSDPTQTMPGVTFGSEDATRPSRSPVVDVASVAENGVRLRFAQGLTKVALPAADAMRSKEQVQPGARPDEPDGFRRWSDLLASKVGELVMLGERVPSEQMRAAAIVLVLVLVALLFVLRANRARRQGSASHRRITRAEREQRLAELRAWLSDEPRVTDRAGSA